MLSGGRNGVHHIHISLRFRSYFTGRSDIAISKTEDSTDNDTSAINFRRRRLSMSTFDTPELTG